MERLKIQDRQRKIAVYAWMGVVVLGLLLWRLFNLSMVQGPALAKLGTSDRVRALPILAPRGKMYDRHGQLLVTNRPAYAAYYFSLTGPPDKEETLSLQKVLNIAPNKLKIAIDTFTAAPYIPVLLKSDLTAAEFTRVKEQAPSLPGVFVDAVPLRTDLLGSVGGQTIGYVGAITQGELQAWKKAIPSLSGGDIVGQTGLEAEYEAVLQGTDGGQEVEVNAQGRPVRTLGEKAPIPGDNLILTLDKGLEETTATALEADMKLLQNSFHVPANAGAAVVMNIHTGQILAMVSIPSYNPNDFSSGISTKEYSTLVNNPNDPFLNRVIQSAFPPGSTYKPAVALAGLMSGAITPETRIPGEARYWYPPYPKNWIDAFFGDQNVSQAIAQSDDVFFYEVGRLTGIDNIAKWSSKLGFGKPTGIDLPNEVTGIVPTKQTYIKQDGAFYEGVTYSVAIGQGDDEATLLQLVRMVGAIATDGYVMKPYLVEKVVSPTGKTISTTKPDVMEHIKAPLPYWRAIQEGMHGVTLPGSIPGPGGTAGAAFVNFPMQVAGKTGTAQVPGAGSATFFESYAPYQNPQIAVVVAVEHGVEGANDASVVRAIYDKYFHLKDPTPPFKTATPTRVKGD